MMTTVEVSWCWCCRFGIERPDIYSPFFLILFPLISVPLVQHHQAPTPTEPSFSSSFPPPVFRPIFYPSCSRNFFLRPPPTSSHHWGRLFLVIRDCQLQAVKNERYLRIRRRKLNCDFSFLIVEPSANQGSRENINLYPRNTFSLVFPICLWLPLSLKTLLNLWFIKTPWLIN